MSEQASYFRLGVFVLVGLGLIIGGAIMLGAGAWMKTTIPAETYFNESVQGLEVGAAVRYRGVQIGKVKRVGLVTEKYEMKSIADDVRFGQYVLVDMELDPVKLPKSPGRPPLELLKERVAAGMRIRLQSSITGPTMLEVDYLDPAVYKPLEIIWKPDLQYLPSAPGTMSQMVSAVERLASEIEKAQVATFINNLNKLATDLNKTVLRVDGILASQQRNIELLVENLRKVVGSLAAISEDAKANPSRVIFGEPPPRIKPGETK